jgi:hypothetical protein
MSRKRHVSALVLALAVCGSTSAHAQDKPTRSFASLDEGVGIASEGDRFSATFHFLFQGRGEYAARSGGRDATMGVRLARPMIRGNLGFTWLHYFVQAELAGEAPRLLDADISAQPLPELGVHVGQFVTPFAREFPAPPGALLLTEFAPSNVFFRNNRDTGVMLTGGLWGSRLEWWAAALNGNGIDKPGNDNAQLEYIGRINANVIGKHPPTENPQLGGRGRALAFGVNASHDDTERTATLANGSTQKLGSSDVNKLGVDGALWLGALSVQTEIYALRRTRAGALPASARGGFAQMGLFVVPQKVEVAVRGDLLAPDTSKSADRELAAGLNLYLAKEHLKLQLRYANRDARSGLTTAGTTHAVALQLQAWF